MRWSKRCWLLCWTGFCLLYSSMSLARPRNIAQEMLTQYQKSLGELQNRKIVRLFEFNVMRPSASYPRRELLLTLATPPVGEVLTSETMLGIWSRLMKTGYFARCRYSGSRCTKSVSRIGD